MEIGIGLAMMIVMMMVMNIAGWCLVWLHPLPRGFNAKEGEREREMTRD